MEKQVTCGNCNITFLKTTNLYKKTEHHYCSLYCKELGRIRYNGKTSEQGLLPTQVYELLRNSEWMHKQYIVEEKSSSQIGDILGVNAITVSRWLKRHNIERRNQSESRKVLFDNPEWKESFLSKMRPVWASSEFSEATSSGQKAIMTDERREKLRQQALDGWAKPGFKERMSPIRREASRKMWENPEHRRKVRASTRRHWHMFAKGRVKDYGESWEQSRRAARRRDNFHCQSCGVHQRELPRQLDVHHIKPFREFGFIRGENDNDIIANQLDNLISLCQGCHRRVEVGNLPLPPRV